MPGSVDTEELETGEPLWDPMNPTFTGSYCPSPNGPDDDERDGVSNQRPGKCGDFIELGTSARLSAVAAPGYRFHHWRAGADQSAGVPCPCEDSPDPECSFTVTERVYCGAVFTSAM
jgi:hypothetical protein